MSSIKIKYSFIVLVIATLLSIIKITGLYLDKTAERFVRNLYLRDSSGVIDGLQSISIVQDKKQAILFIHGFADSPKMFSDLVTDIEGRVNSDIYVPLLPFHGRDLRALSQLNNTIVLNALDRTINTLAKKYESLTVVGMSYGGALTATLAKQNKIPANVRLILYAPAFFITSNTIWSRSEAQGYSWWRSYCNYAALGCGSPSYQSGDAVAKPMIDKEKIFHYVVIPALLQVYQLDSANREALSTLHRPYSLIIAEDDNRVSYQQEKAACKANQSYCHLYSFASGKHLIHWGANKQAFEDVLVNLILKTKQ